MAVRVVTTETPVIRVVGSAASSASAPINSTSIVKVFAEGTEIRVLPPTSQSIEVKPTASPDVKVSSPQVMTFKAVIIQGPKGDPGDGTGGSSEISSDFFVTNTVGDVKEEYEIGEQTDLELVIREMLSDTDVTITAVASIKKDGSFETDGFRADITSTIELSSITLNVKNAKYLDINPIQVRLSPSGQFVTTIPKANLTEDYKQTYVFEGPVVLTGSVGENKITVTHFWQDEIAFNYGPSSLSVSSQDVIKFYLGKKIRVITSVCANPYGSNISPNPLNQEPNLYQSESNLIVDILNKNPNELIYSEVIHDFNSVGREVIVPLKKESNTYSVFDNDRYVIIELPSEFSLSEVAATTAGSGAYSLTNSIVYLGDSNTSGNNYVNEEGHDVKYYRFVAPGAFTEDLKLDLEIKLSE
jgi:hypothetical protein